MASLISNEGFSRDSWAFSVTWNIDNFLICPKKHHEALHSPEFIVGCLGASKWRLTLYPRGDMNPKYVSCFLERLTGSSKLKKIIVKFCFAIVNLDDDSPDCYIYSFRENQRWGITYYKHRDYLVAMLGSQLLYKLTVKCWISPSEIHLSLRDEVLGMHILSNDYKYLCESGFLHDIVLKCYDQIFKVHRAIIFARAPKFAAEIHIDCLSGDVKERQLSNITPDALKCLLLFLYSGRPILPVDYLLTELLVIAEKYDLHDLSKALKSYPRNYTCCTNMNVEYKSINWRIQRNISNNIGVLTKIVPVEEESVENLIMRCSFERNYYNIETERFDLSLSFSKFNKNQPISIWVDISILHRYGWLLSRFEDCMFFETNEEKKKTCYILILNAVPEFVINCNLTICYGERHTCLESSSNITELANTYIIDYSSLCLDYDKLLTSVNFCDATLIAENNHFPVHRAILSVRSTVFKQMFECDMIEKMTGVVYIGDLPADTVKSLLTYAYTGQIDPLSTDFLSLYSAADKYAFLPLFKLCSAHLMEDLNIQNSCLILIVAHCHSDNELQLQAILYIRRHFREVIKTFYWKILSENFKTLTGEILSGLDITN